MQTVSVLIEEMLVYRYNDHRALVICVIAIQKNPYLFCGEQGLVRYWHIGNKRNANAIVARTVEKNKAQQ